MHHAKPTAEVDRRAPGFTTRSTWHNLTPIAMVNPCIVAPGPVTIKKGQTLRLRYGLVVHDGPVDLELLSKVSKRWRER